MTHSQKNFRIVIPNPRRGTIPVHLCLHAILRDIDLIARKTGRNFRLESPLIPFEPGMQNIRLGGKTLIGVPYFYPYAKSNNVLNVDKTLLPDSPELKQYKEAFGDLGNTLRSYLEGVPEHIVFLLPETEWPPKDRDVFVGALLDDISPIVLVSDGDGKRMEAVFSWKSLPWHLEHSRIDEEADETISVGPSTTILV